MSAGPVARFDNGYLDEHPEVARQLGVSPGLADNPQFLATHPGLDRYLANHPEVRQELQSHPYRFMSTEWRDDLYGHRGVNAGAVARFDNGYLDEHPEVRTELLQHPDRFMDGEWRYEHYEDRAHPLASTDRYMDSHPEVAQQLVKNPRLVDNAQFVQN